VLARCLEQTGRDDLEQAFRLYEGTRKPRASAIQAKSSTNTLVRTDGDPGWVYYYDAWRAPLGKPPAVPDVKATEHG